MYTIAFIDRTNVSLALPSMSRDLHLDPAQAGAAAGIFFWGYFVLQIPGGYLASHWSPKRFISILLVAWGLCSVATAFVHTGGEFWTMRLLLGVAEGGVWPATLVLLANWFPRPERARANALWMMCLPLAVVLSSPLSGWILGRWGWRVLLASEGLLPFVWLLAWVCLVQDHPKEAKWISAVERAHLETTLRREAALFKPVEPEAYWRALLRPQVLMLVGIAFLLYAGNYGYLFWLPTAISASRLRGMAPSGLQVGFLNAIPYLIATLAMLLVSRHSDRKLERRGHVAAALAWSGVCLLAATLEAGRSPALYFVLLSLAAAGPLAALAPLYAIPTEMLPREVAGAAMGLVCALGNLGGYYGPLAMGYFSKRTGNLTEGFGVLGACLLVGSALALRLRRAGELGALQRLFVFVCSGNTSRSPMAQAICNAEIARRLGLPLEALGEFGVRAVSAGLSARMGSPMAGEAIAALGEIGVPALPHASQNLTAELVAKAEAIFCMTGEQRRATVERFPEALKKTYCLNPDGDLDDPSGKGLEVFLSLAQWLQALVRRRLNDLGLACSPPELFESGEAARCGALS